MTIAEDLDVRLAAMGHPVALTLDDVCPVSDPKERQRWQLRLIASGYLAARNPFAKDGHYMIQGKRRTVYVRTDCLNAADAAEVYYLTSNI